MPDETLHSELHDAKAHAREAARATLLAVRSALDFALNKLGDDAPTPRPDAADATSTPPAGPRADSAD